ncbi:MAG: hypothetical protein ABIK81_04495 [candidate division WOR-3 bacterium]
MLCELCQKRRGKRDCPATGNLICNECCGTRRRKLISCPDNCQYLQKSRDYFQEKILTEYEMKTRKIFFSFFQKLEGKIVELQKTRLTDLTDAEVEEALEQNLANLNLKKKVIVYEYKSVNPKVQILSDAISEMLNSLQKVSSEAPFGGLLREGEKPYDLETIIFLLKEEIGFLKRLIKEDKGDTYYLNLINILH